jgi:hypothetical protein
MPLHSLTAFQPDVQARVTSSDLASGLAVRICRVKHGSGDSRRFRHGRPQNPVKVHGPGRASDLAAGDLELETRTFSGLNDAWHAVSAFQFLGARKKWGPAPSLQGACPHPGKAGGPAPSFRDACPFFCMLLSFASIRFGPKDPNTGTASAATGNWSDSSPAKPRSRPPVQLEDKKTTPTGSLLSPVGRASARTVMCPNQLL